MNYFRQEDTNCHLLADVEARIFKKASEDKIPSYFFIKSFSYNKDTFVLDDLRFLNGFSSEEEIYLSTVSKINSKRGEVYEVKIMHWIGYFYRTFCYLYNFTSREVFELISPKYLKEVYPLYHTQDIKKAIAWTIEHFNIKKETKDQKIRRILTTVF